jgi:hypothetical protein
LCAIVFTVVVSSKRRARGNGGRGRQSAAKISMNGLLVKQSSIGIDRVAAAMLGEGEGEREGKEEDGHEHKDKDKDKDEHEHKHEQTCGEKLTGGAEQTRVWGWWQLPRSGWCLTMHAALSAGQDSRIRGSVWGRRG